MTRDAPSDRRDPGGGTDLSALRRSLADLRLIDSRRLGRRLERVGRIGDPDRRERALADVLAGVADATAVAAARRLAVPTLVFPEALPVSARRDEIAAAIRDHQVVVLAGETGSGKTTQLPKICLGLGRGVRGMIGHTQPRRIAARAVAERIAAECGVPLGGAVGYQVRFTDRVDDTTLVKVMTDGILLAEIESDRELLRYDTVIVDEAHERSLNIDFLIGYLHRLLPRRPDLKVIITSATIDPHRFADHFGGAPVVEVSGRTYPVEIRYRPLVEPPAPDEDDDDEPAAPRDRTQAIVDALAELDGPGDTLVFLSGEREIRDTADALTGTLAAGAEIVPLYARLSAEEQHRVFAPHRGRRIVLATNVAETSLTVPGIRYVVDPGTARISRYSHRLKVQRLPIEPVSQASADQRAGRCGRVSDGVCVRLYSREDYDSRPRFTDPEVRRTSLASVILRMAALGLGDVADFPFLDPPDRRQVSAGVALLEELGALVPGGDGPPRLTPVGRRLASLPVDPRLGRMLVAADAEGCLTEALVIVSGLSVQDPRERPVDRQEAADRSHRRFADPTSDFLAYWNLWRYLREQQRELSGNAFRRRCREEFLHYLRVREWQDLHGQLRSACRDVGLTRNDAPAGADQVHRALLGGLLSHVGLRQEDRGDYLGARGARFALWPGSSLARRKPDVVVVGELVETSRLWGRVVARIEPEWAEQVAGPLAKRSYSEPRWDPERGESIADERVTLFGVPLVAGRRVSLARTDPELARGLFVRHALVEGDWRSSHAFIRRNAERRREAEEVERRSRRRGIGADDEALFTFFDERVPADVVSARHFDRWWKRMSKQDPDLLTFPPGLLTGGAEASGDDYPDRWPGDDLQLRLRYQFEPGEDADGVTVRIPLPVLNRVRSDPFEWQVPGLREELVTGLIRSLPKAIRRSFVPAPTFALAALERMTPYRGPVREALAEVLTGMGGPVVTARDFQEARLPTHLRMTFRVDDERGRRLGESTDLTALQHRLGERLRRTVSEAVGAERSGWHRDGLTTWDLDVLPPVVTESVGGREVRGYPALVDAGGSVSVRVLGTPEEAERATAAGVRRLLLLAWPSPVKAVLGGLDNRTRLALGWSPYPTVPALLDDCVKAAVDSIVADLGGVPRDRPGFEAVRDAGAPRLRPLVGSVVAAVAAVCATAHDVRERAGALPPALIDVRDDVLAVLDDLVFDGFVPSTGAARLPDVDRYVRALQRRLESLPDRLGRDRALMGDVQRLEADAANWIEGLPAAQQEAAAVVDVWWSLQELRVSLFAQTLGTPRPVSEKRIRNAMAAVGRG